MNLFNDIIADNESGSGTILRKVQTRLIEFGENKSDISIYLLHGEVQSLLNQFSQFGLLIHFLGAFKRFLVKEKIAGNQLSSFINTYQEKWRNVQNQASLKMISEIDFIEKQVLVHSNSSAIHNLFYQLKSLQPKPVVWQTYSSPAGEGRLQAEIISDLGCQVNLIHEDAISKFINQIDFAIFGADIILEDQFLNKTGTFPISLMFNHFNKPVYVLAETRKVFESSELGPDMLHRMKIESKKVDAEIYAAGNQYIHTHNYYFEFTPLSLVKSVFLD